MHNYDATLEQNIPPGPYCYFGSRAPGDPDYKPCPHWRKLADYEEQLNGYCTYLKLGDYMEDGTLLLWDQVKECGINDDFDLVEALLEIEQVLADSISTVKSSNVKYSM